MNGSIRNMMGKLAGVGKTLGAAVISVVVCMPASAQEDDSIFEEIVVVVKGREMNLMDTPVAVSNTTGAQLVDAGIKDMFELQQNVPNLIVGQSQSATTSNFAIRGIGSTSNNFGVESSVGLYVDGVYRSRQGTMINDLIDVETVDVLRGPQGTLFGKNTAAGAISVHSVRPSQDTDAFVDVTFGSHALLKLSGAMNLAITENIAMRGTVFSSQRDGYVDDLQFGDDTINDRNRYGLRLQLAGDDLADGTLNWRIIADYAEIDEVCCGTIPRVDSLYYKGSLANPMTITTGSDAANAVLGGAVFANYPYPQALIDAFGPNANIIQNSSFDDYTSAVTDLPVSTNEDAGLSFDIDKTFGNGMKLASISAYRSFETFDSIDIDFSDLDLIHRDNTAEQTSFSQEFNLSGDFGSGSNWVAGVYYFKQSLDSNTTTTAGDLFNAYASILNPLLADAVAGTQALYAASQIPGHPLEPLAPLLSPATLPFPAGATALDVVTQDHESYAAFGEVNFAMSDKFTLTLGARYTSEDKDFTADYTQTANGPPPDLAAIGATLGALQAGDIPTVVAGILSGALVPISEPNVAWGMYQFAPFAPRSNIVESISDDQSTGTVKLSWFPADSTMIYASYATGFKAGGTNTDRIDQSFDQVFGAETSASSEIGLKGQYGPVRLTATIYQTDFEDFQANSFTGSGFNLQNAGDLSVEGYELEIVWRPFDATEIAAFYTHNEGTYDSFEDGTAWDTWVVQEGLWLDPPQGDPGCDQLTSPLPQSCPRTGDPIAYNPEDRAFVSIRQDFELGANTSLYALLEYTYASSQFTDGDLDPFSEQSSVSMLNARLGINIDSLNTSVTLWGRNVTDERWYHGSFDVPVAEDKMLSYPSEPATYGLTLRTYFD